MMFDPFAQQTITVETPDCEQTEEDRLEEITEWAHRSPWSVDDYRQAKDNALFLLKVIERLQWAQPTGIPNGVIWG